MPGIKEGSAGLSKHIWILTIIFVAVIWPRFVFLGYFPNMDEGFYAWQAADIWSSLKSGLHLPNYGTLSLYPILLSWVYELPGNHLFWLRLCDLLVSAIAGYLFCLVIFSQSKNWLLAILLSLIFLCAMNHANVIDRGFKNSISAAFIPLFSAFLIVKPNLAPISQRWFAVGSLVAISVLLREPFAIFAILGFFSIWIGWNWQAVWRYAISGIITGFIIFFIAGLIRGSLWILIKSYLNATSIYSAQSARILPNFIDNGLDFFHTFTIPCFLFIVLLVYMLTKDNLELFHSAIKTKIFWLSAILLPLLEPALKLGFLYHFAISLAPLGASCSFFFLKTYKNWLKIITWIFLIAGLIGAVFTLPSPWQLHYTINMLRHFPETGWPEQYIEQSNTLKAAKIITDFLPDKGSFSSSGFTYFLYPAVESLPPRNGDFDALDKSRLSDLSRSYMSMGYNPDLLVSSLKNNPPDVIAVAKAHKTHEPDNAEAINNIINLTNLYEKIGEVPQNNALDYGWLEYQIYVKK